MNELQDSLFGAFVIRIKPKKAVFLRSSLGKI